MKGTIAVLFAAAALALLAACTNPVSGRTAGDPVTGSLALTIAGLPVDSGARTLVPSSTDLPALASYDVVVSREGYADRTATFSSSTGSVAGLEPGGPWTVTVSGKDSGGLVVATGSFSPLTIELPGPTAAAVSLAYVAAASGAGNTGAMAITIVFPKSAGVDGVEAWLDNAAVSPALAVAGYDENNSKVVYAASGLASSSSQLVINLKRGSSLVLPWAEQVWVYRNITTTNTETIALSAFSAAPPAPASLAATLKADGTVNLLWPNVGTAQSYKLERSADGGSLWSKVSDALAAASTSGTDAVTIAEATYRYRISATNVFGSSAPTATTADLVVTPAFIVAYDKAKVALTYAGSDSAASVTRDLTLVASASSGTTIGWATTNAAITDAGLVTRPDGTDAMGSLTATVSNHGVIDTVVFALTVKATGTSGISINSPSAPAAAGFAFTMADLATAISGFIVIKGTTTTVGTALASATSYAWHLDNGSETLSATRTCAVDPGSLGLGAHTLSLTAVKDGRTYSGRIAFTLYQHPGVLFDANGGSGTMAMLVIPKDGSLALTANAFTRTGYYLAGWATSASGSVAYAGGASYTMASAAPVTLFAKWATINYTITYMNGGTIGSNPVAYTILSSEVTLAAATRSGYSFGGWYSDAALTTAVTTIAAGSTGNRSLYAKWTGISYTVSFDSQGGSSPSPASIDATCGSTYGTLATTGRNGYSFGGWYTGTGGTGTLISAGSAVAITAATTLYAKWTGNSYTVTFDGQTGTSPSPATVSVTYASSYGTLATSTLSDYILAGWWTGAGGTGSQITSGSTVTVTADQTLYAKWTKGPFTFTNAGQTGRLGPSQSQLDSAYASTTLAGLVTATDSGIQRWVVPATGSYRIEAYGAQGSAKSGYGQGAIMKGDVTLSAGEVLWILVGQMGGGGLYDPTNVGAYGHPSGGGGSFVAKGAAQASSTAVMVAGGGGGDYLGSADSGGSTGSGGNSGYGTVLGGTAGGPGSSISGMHAAAGFTGSSTGANSFLAGGQGAYGPTTSYHWNGDGGFGGGGAMYSEGQATAGGGGGYSGGGSASPTNGMTMYGGGGGSWNSGSAQSNSAGGNPGMGKVVITLK